MLNSIHNHLLKWIDGFSLLEKQNETKIGFIYRTAICPTLR